MRIFISYSRADHQSAEAVAKTLKQAGHQVFFDKHSIKAADDFNRIIWGEIRKAELFIFLISPNSIRPGSYALTELSFAEKKWPNPERRVLSVLVEPTELTNIPIYTSICHILRPEGNVAASIRAEVLKLHSRHRWIIVGRVAALIIGFVLIGLASLWGYQSYSQQKPIKARSTLTAVGISFDEYSFIDYSSRGDLDAVALFLKAGMDPNVTLPVLQYHHNNPKRFSWKTTPLMAAINYGKVEVVKQLLKAGADVYAKNGEGATVLNLAKEKGNKEIIELLQNATD